MLKPSAVTEADYRLYSEEALEILQQILFFKEFDMSEYFNALEEFKIEQKDIIIRTYGSMDKYDEYIEALASG